MIPRATYRLQFTPDFGFDDAARLAPYLARLGISHLYASPYLKARPSSQHGYDIVDHTMLNPELGDDAAFARMNAALKRHGLEQILDFVPNHMGVGGSDNPFWLDVLEWGPDAAHAGWFDIDWTTDRLNLRDKILVPFLGNQYGIELEAGRLVLKFDPTAGSFAVWAYDTHKLPISPFHYGTILGADHAELERLGDEFSNIASWRPQVRHRAEELKGQLARIVRDDPRIAAAVQAVVDRLNGTAGDSPSWSELDDLIQRQNWRAAHFRVAADDVNYRRFFNINDLAGLRMELPAVFDHAHELVFRLMRESIVDGLRIDHIDGLLDPKAYLERLRAEAPSADGQRFYLVVEKILAEHEALRADWPIDGTTGYEIANLLLGVLIDPEAEVAFTRIYADFIGQTERFSNILRASKKRIMDNEMASELNGLARRATRIALQNPKTADFTLNILRRALREIVACFPVYRTYVDFAGTPTQEDRDSLDEAIAEARLHETAIDVSVYDFLRQVLTGDLVAHPRSGFSRQAVLRCALRFQQYSGPVTAKGLEDTAFYVYNRFVALNEVGGHPTTFGMPLAELHAANRERAKRWPVAMLSTSSHDTKRGEDTRARLAVLSEFPDEWAEQVSTWSRLLRPNATRIGPDATPDRNDEYALLQLLVGTWPVELLDEDAPDSTALAAYAERLNGAVTKSMREAKIHTTWATPNQAYEDASLAFLDGALTGPLAKAFIPAFRPFVAKVARLGIANSIVQTVLKLTIPGVPDIYQGAELWDLSMVDPDNRRPIDFGLRQNMLEEAEARLVQDRAAAMTAYARDWRDGHVKLAVLATILAWRRRNPALFASGDYAPVAVKGPQADAVFAFTRRHGDRILLVAVARFPGRRERSPLDAQTHLVLPAGLEGSTWTDLLTGRAVAAADHDALTADGLFTTLPASVLVRS